MITTYRHIGEINAANLAAGEHWFSRATEQQFHSRLETPVMAGRYWVESILNTAMTGREFMLCVAHENGVVEHLGVPQTLYWASSYWAAS